MPNGLSFMLDGLMVLLSRFGWVSRQPLLPGGPWVRSLLHRRSYATFAAPLVATLTPLVSSCSILLCSATQLTSGAGMDATSISTELLARLLLPLSSMASACSWWFPALVGLKASVDPLVLVMVEPLVRIIVSAIWKLPGLVATVQFVSSPR